jgi:protein TonB
VFESFVESRKKPLRARALGVTASILVHGGGLALVLFLSLFYVEELPEPPVTVTFFSAPPPPPPPPPPAAPKTIERPKTALARPTPKPSEVQPPEKLPVAQPKKDEPKLPSWAQGGSEGGSEDGVEGGLDTGAPRPPEKKAEPKKQAPAQPVFVRQQVVEKLKLSGEMPEYVPAARMAKVEGVVMVRLCLKADGTVDPAETRIIKSLPSLDEEVLSKVKGWRYKPYMVDGVATPVCFPARFVFKFQ